MFIDMAHVKLGLCNYLNTSKEMITEYAIHSRFNKFQNVFFKNGNMFNGTNFTVRFVSFMGRKKIWSNCNVFWKSFLNYRSLWWDSFRIAWADKSCRDMEVVMRKRNNCRKQPWFGKYFFQLKSCKKQAWLNILVDTGRKLSVH